METKKKILIIDDEPDIAFLVKQVLTGASFEVEVASGGIQVSPKHQHRTST